MLLDNTGRRPQRPNVHDAQVDPETGAHNRGHQARARTLPKHTARTNHAVTETEETTDKHRQAKEQPKRKLVRRLELTTVQRFQCH